MTDHDPAPPTTAASRMYLVPPWVILYATVVVLLAVAVLVWQSPFVGLFGVITLVVVLLAAVGATPASVHARMGRIQVAPVQVDNSPTMPVAAVDPEARVRVTAASVARVLGKHDIEYHGGPVTVAGLRQMAEAYWNGTPGRPPTRASRDASRSLDELGDRAMERSAQRAADRAHRQGSAA